MKSTVSLTVVILTHNEEDTIEKCLNSVLWCDEILLFDDSTDKTLSLAHKILGNKFRAIKTVTSDFAEIRNSALAIAKCPWVLFLDADEVVTYALKQEIEQTLPKTANSGFYLKRKDYFLGRWLKYGETGDAQLLKLARKDSGKWRRRVHEVWESKGDTRTIVTPLEHFPHPTVGEFLDRINRWTTLDAEEFFAAGESSSFTKILLFPVGKFVKNYFMKQGFRDGMPGIIMATMMSFHSFLTRAKLYMLKQEMK